MQELKHPLTELQLQNIPREAWEEEESREWPAEGPEKSQPEGQGPGIPPILALGSSSSRVCFVAYQEALCKGYPLPPHLPLISKECSTYVFELNQAKLSQLSYTAIGSLHLEKDLG